MRPPIPPPFPEFTGEDRDPRARRFRGRHGDREFRRHPGRPPGFGPGFPPGFGPGFGFGGPRGRRGGRRTSRGDIRLAVLALLAEQPRHGYEIIQEIAERSGGNWRPSPGSVYPTLMQLRDEGLVLVEKPEGEARDGKRVSRLTEAGTDYVMEHRAEIDAVWASAEADDNDEVPLWTELRAVHAAAQQVFGAGTPEQVTAATTALTEARKTIYRLLAE